MPPKKKLVAQKTTTAPLPKPYAAPIATIRPEPTPFRRYLLLMVLIMMAISASYLLLTGAGLRRPRVDQKQAVSEDATIHEPQEQPQDDATSIIERVRSHISIQTEGNPAMWTVSSVDLVRTQNPVLFKDAELGDYVLAWKDRVVVYSPSRDKIVGMMMLDSSLNGAGSAGTSTSINAVAVESPKIEIRNASGIAGGAKSLKKRLTDAGLTVEKIGDAAVRRTGTVIVDLTGGTAARTISLIQSSASGTVVTAVPDGEPASQAEILVLIGK